MPLSKNRKSHSQKLKQRKTEIINNKLRIDKMYKSIYEELRSRPTSVTDMLNKEEEADELPNSLKQTTLSS